MWYAIHMGEVALFIALGALGVAAMAGVVAISFWLIERYHNWRVRRIMLKSEKRTRSNQQAKEKQRAAIRVIPGGRSDRH